MARLAVLLLSVLACAAVASAATPAEGTVSADAPEAKWSGTVADPLGAAYFAAVEAGSTADVCATPVPACDTYTLKVAGEGALKLTFAVKADVADDWVGLSVTDPAGKETLAFEDDADATIAIAKPAPGDYTVHVLASPSSPGDVGYAGVATLELPPPPPPPAATATPAPTPQPTPPPSSEPPPAGTPFYAGPRELAVEADVRRVKTAVLKGFRARVLCRGGCDSVRLRIFVSSLTARTYRIDEDARGDVRVGGARTLRAAEGRRTARMTFKKSVRRKLSRAKNLTLAIEAVARDADGRVRRVTKRHVLRR